MGTEDLKNSDQHGAGQDHTGLATPVPATRQASRQPEDMSREPQATPSTAHVPEMQELQLPQGHPQGQDGT